MLISPDVTHNNMAPPRKNVESRKKPVKVKSTRKAATKSSFVSSGVLIALSVAIGVFTAVYYTKKNPSNTSEDSPRAADSSDGTERSGDTSRDPYLDFTVLPRLDGVKVGHVQKMQLSTGKLHEVKTLSLRPPIFEIPDFLTDAECQQIIDTAKRNGLETSEVQDPETGINIEPNTAETFRDWDYNHDGVLDKTEVMHNLIDLNDLYFSEKDVEQMFAALNVDKNNNGVMEMEEFLKTTTAKIMKYLHGLAKRLSRVKSRNSEQTWLDHRKIKGLNNKVAALTQLPRAVIEGSEELQVVHYDPEGHYHCHHDSQDLDPTMPCCYFRDKRPCRLCRYITVLYFLNDVEEGGETAFPVADNATFSTEAWAAITKQRCDLSKHCHKANVWVAPKKRTAIMWYNHVRDDRTGWAGGLDPMTYHGGCDIIRGEKWIANNWINILGQSRDTMVSYKSPKKVIGRR